MKTIPCLLLLLSIFSVTARGQANDSLHNSYVVDSTTLKTYKQNRINLDLLGISYIHESPFGKKNTIIARTGVIMDVVATLQLGSTGTRHEFNYAIVPVIAVGTRYYYRLKPPSITYQRNLGYFIGAELGLNISPLYQKNLSSPTAVFLLPYWGFQKRVSRKLDLELGLGLAIKYYSGKIDPYPNIQLRLGHTF